MIIRFRLLKHFQVTIVLYCNVKKNLFRKTCDGNASNFLVRLERLSSGLQPSVLFSLLLSLGLKSIVILSFSPHPVLGGLDSTPTSLKAHWCGELIVLSTALQHVDEDNKEGKSEARKSGTSQYVLLVVLRHWASWSFCQNCIERKIFFF